MESSTTAKASEYLANFSDAVVDRGMYEVYDNQVRGSPVLPTSISIFTSCRGAILKTKIINSFPKYRGLILNFYDYDFPRPFSKLEKLEVIYLDPAFKKYEILEAPDDRIMIVLDTCDDFP